AQPFVATGDGVHSLDFNATNGAGLNEATHHIAIRIDTTPPVSTSTLSGSLGNDSWYVSVVTVVLSATDATSGVANLSYRIDGGSWSLYAAPFFLNEGRHTLDYHATDIAGLSDIGHSVSVKVDTTKPVSTAAASGTPGNNGWYVTLATLVLNASDLTSGVARISYRVDGGPWQTYSVPFVLGEGVHLVEYNATDNAGLTETTNSLTVKVDTVAPVTTASLSGTPGSNGWFVSAVTVYLNATDATSGVSNITYRIDGGNWTAYSGPFTLADGVHLIEYHATDVAGLVELTKSRTVSIDTVPPTTTATLSGTAGANGWFVSAVTVTLSATDATSGVTN